MVADCHLMEQDRPYRRRRPRMRDQGSHDISLQHDRTGDTAVESKLVAAGGGGEDTQVTRNIYSRVPTSTQCTDDILAKR